MHYFITSPSFGIPSNSCTSHRRQKEAEVWLVPAAASARLFLFVCLYRLLIASQLSPEQRELAETIFDSSNALLCTLADILDFSVLDEGPEGALPLRKEPVCLQHALEGVAEMVSPAAKAKGLELCVLVEPGLWGRHLLGDGTRVRQVLHQLVTNAVKFTERGQVMVHAHMAPPPAAAAPAGKGSGTGESTAAAGGGGGGGKSGLEEGEGLSLAKGGGQVEQQQEAGDVLHISVHDSGIGIKACQLPQLFDCFKQGHGEGMSRKYGGTGELGSKGYEGKGVRILQADWSVILQVKP
jgi:signal transduction histidine kinase